jgi:hypothetical protein
VRNLSHDEIDDLKVIGDNRTTEETHVFTINGLAAVKNYRKLRSTVQIELGSELENFGALKPEEMTHKDLRSWSNWANRVDIRLREARNIIEDCKRFLLPSNLDQIRRYKRML